MNEENYYSIQFKFTTSDSAVNNGKITGVAIHHYPPPVLNLAPEEHTETVDFCDNEDREEFIRDFVRRTTDCYLSYGTLEEMKQ